MSDFEGQIPDPFFLCDQCGDKLSINDFAFSAMMYGVVFLHSKEFGYFGVICPSCKKLALQKSNIGYVFFVKEKILSINSERPYKYVQFRYDSFPYSHNLPERNDSLYEFNPRYFDSYDHIYQKALNPDTDSTSPRSYLSYLQEDRSVYHNLSILVVKEADINNIQKLENDTGLKGFPRWSVFFPWLKDVNTFTWRYWLNHESDMNINNTIYKDHLALDSRKKIQLNHDFLKVLEKSRLMNFPSVISSLPMKCDQYGINRNEILERLHLQYKLG